MQLSSKIQGYFGHVTMEFAISKGWDFEQDLAEFYKDIDLNVPYMGLSTGQEITEADVFKASQGEITPSFATFWSGFTIKEEAPDDDVFMQSMHSGSSDMLFVKDVRHIQEVVKTYLQNA
ncbi:hypothetical protein bas34_0092 [Escherichia phage SelmaRatti]|uniref:Uncharacterized protein n=1 Tax=Escherichia phage SelmaRatti TaxID=2852006 RepID=A0AAE8B4N3_9CAUD|nr:hypothetical protein bas34_0092 [Escherichia phage SelmaRatti]